MQESPCGSAHFISSSLSLLAASVSCHWGLSLLPGAVLELWWTISAHPGTYHGTTWGLDYRHAYFEYVSAGTNISILNLWYLNHVDVLASWQFNQVLRKFPCNAFHSVEGGEVGLAKKSRIFIVLIAIWTSICNQSMTVTNSSNL